MSLTTRDRVREQAREAAAAAKRAHQHLSKLIEILGDANFAPASLVTEVRGAASAATETLDLVKQLAIQSAVLAGSESLRGWLDKIAGEVSDRIARDDQEG